LAKEKRERGSRCSGCLKSPSTTLDKEKGSLRRNGKMGKRKKEKKKGKKKGKRKKQGRD